MTQNKQKKTNLYTIHLDTGMPPIAIRSDTYSDDGSNYAFYNNVSETVRSTQAVFLKQRVVAVIKNQPI